MNNEDDTIIKRFIIIMVIIILVAIGIYFFTKVVVKKDTSSTTSDSTTSTSIDYTKAIVGTMLNKKDSEYYVILYSSASSDATTYKGLVTSYSALSGSLPVYTVDLSNALNTKYYDATNTNPTATNLNDLRFGNITVIKVKSSQITNAYESISAIKKVWKIS